MRIAVLGAGNVGGALGRLWAGKGHQVVFSSKRRGSNAEAAKDAEVVALCVPWGAAEEAIHTAGDLAGKIVVDCTNPLAPDLSGLVVGHTTSAAEKVAGWAPRAKVVKAFNTIGAANYGNAQFGALRADGFYCGDDAEAKTTVRQLIEAAGLEPVDVGPLRNARYLEPLAMLWIDLAYGQRQGPDHAFKLLRR